MGCWAWVSWDACESVTYRLYNSVLIETLVRDDTCLGSLACALTVLEVLGAQCIEPRY